jgi:hypothetical protein
LARCEQCLCLCSGLVGDLSELRRLLGGKAQCSGFCQHAGNRELSVLSIPPDLELRGREHLLDLPHDAVSDSLDLGLLIGSQIQRRIVQQIVGRERTGRRLTGALLAGLTRWLLAALTGRLLTGLARRLLAGWLLTRLPRWLLA